MNTFILEIITARATKFADNILHYLTHVNLFLEFSHAPF